MSATLRRAHTCQIRSTSALDSPLCGRWATARRYDWIFGHWVCPEHDRKDRLDTNRGVWPADRRRYRANH